METNMMEMITKLSQSVNELEYSVMQAYDSFLTKYGAGSEFVARLESYFNAIDKQREFIDELELCVRNKNYALMYEISNKIVAISDLIKNDARSLLFSMSSETTDNTANETIH